MFLKVIVFLVTVPVNNDIPNLTEIQIKA